ncbi:hypothetical protein [Viscerimonas tarda]
MDGEEHDPDYLKTMDPTTIESISVLNDQTAIETYGEKVKDGVIVVKTKKQ